MSAVLALTSLTLSFREYFREYTWSAAVEEGLLIPHKTLAALLGRKGPFDKVNVLYPRLADPEVAHLISQGKQATSLRDTVISILAPVVTTA